MTVMVPIPANLWQKMLGFLQDGSTGQMILDVKDGRVEGCRLTEVVRAERMDRNLAVDEPQRAC